MSRSSWSPLVMAMVLGAWAGAEPAKIVVLPFAAVEGAGDGAAKRAQAAVVDELRGREALTLVPATVLKAGEAAAKKGPNPEVLAALETGRKAFDELRLEEASLSLKKGLEGMLGDPATADFDLVADALVKRAAAAFRLGEERDAKDTLTQLCRLAPAYVLPGGFPPVFQHELEKAKRRVEKAPRALLSIDAPPGATAFIDGRDLGMVPILEEALAAGTHYVRVDGTKGEHFGKAVEVTGHMKVTATFAPLAKEGPVEVPRATAKLDAEALQRLAAYVRALGADGAVVAVVYPLSDAQVGVGAALYSLRKGAVTVLTAAAFDAEGKPARPEVVALCDELVKRFGAFSAAALPVNLTAAKPRVISVGGPSKREDPPRGARRTELKTDEPRKEREPRVELVPSTSAEGDGVATTTATTQAPPDEVKKPVPVWVWIVTGSVAAVGLGVGGYFGYVGLTKPVTGTVKATW